MATSNQPTGINPNLITREELAPGLMKHSAYTSEALRKAIVDHLSCKEHEYAPQQLRGFQQFKSNGTWNFAHPENIHDLKKWFSIFDEIFFNGILAEKCALEWVEKGFRGHYKGYARCSHDPRYYVDKPQVTISLFWDLKNRHAFPEYEISDYMHILLHEMLHAVFQYYTDSGTSPALDFTEDVWGRPPHSLFGCCSCNSEIR